MPQGKLSSATHRALMHPPIPLQVSNVTPGPEFPAPDEGLRTSARAREVFGSLNLPAALMQGDFPYCLHITWWTAASSPNTTVKAPHCTACRPEH